MRRTEKGWVLDARLLRTSLAAAAVSAGLVGERPDDAGVVMAMTMAAALSGCSLSNGRTQIVRVRSVPPDAQVWLDGERVGATPLDVEVRRRNAGPALTDTHLSRAPEAGSRAPMSPWNVFPHGSGRYPGTDRTQRQGVLALSPTGSLRSSREKPRSRRACPGTRAAGPGHPRAGLDYDPDPKATLNPTPLLRYVATGKPTRTAKRRASGKLNHAPPRATRYLQGSSSHELPSSGAPW